MPRGDVKGILRCSTPFCRRKVTGRTDTVLNTVDVIRCSSPTPSPIPTPTPARRIGAPQHAHVVPQAAAPARLAVAEGLAREERAILQGVLDASLAPGRPRPKPWGDGGCQAWCGVVVVGGGGTRGHPGPQGAPDLSHSGLTPGPPDPPPPRPPPPRHIAAVTLGRHHWQLTIAHGCSSSVELRGSRPPHSPALHISSLPISFSVLPSTVLFATRKEVSPAYPLWLAADPTHPLCSHVCKPCPVGSNRKHTCGAFDPWHEVNIVFSSVLLSFAWHPVWA